jgi:hypothetical protein
MVPNEQAIFVCYSGTILNSPRDIILIDGDT